MSGNTLTLHRTLSTAFLAWGVAALLGWHDNVLVGQNPTFTASIDTKEVIVGVPFEVTFTLANAEGKRFTPPSFREFQAAGAVSESRGMTFIKGKASSKQSWSYTLEASRAGVFTIGAAAVTANGQVLNTAPLKIKVLSPAASSKGSVNIPPGRSDDVFILGNLNTAKAFPGQQVTWRLTLYTKVAIEGADLISLPDFEGFYSKEKRRFDTRTQYQTIRGKKYAVKILHEEALFAQTTGELTIGAAQIRVGVDQPGTQGFFFGPKPITLTTQPVTLTVMPLPEPVPENFTGGVGHYEWEVSADTNVLTTDDALTLSVVLKGNGDARRFAAPKIAVPPNCEIFEPRIVAEETYESESEIIHTKHLEYVILPKEPGVQEFVPILTYFDTDSNRYCFIQSAPIRFEVTAGKNYLPPNNRDTVGIPVQTAVQVSLWEKSADFFLSPIFGGVVLLLLLAFALFWFFNKRKQSNTEGPRKPKVDPALAAQQRFANVANIRHGAAPEMFYNELLKALQSYIVVRLNLSPAQLNHATLRAKLAERNVTPIRVQAFLSILQTCEQAVFSGQQEASKMESDWHAAEVVVQALEKEIH